MALQVNNLVPSFDSIINLSENKNEALKIFQSTKNKLDSIKDRLTTDTLWTFGKSISSYKYYKTDIIKMDIHHYKNQILQRIFF